MKKTMHNYRKLLKKNLMLALMFCLILGIGIFTNSVQVKAANSFIEDWKYSGIWWKSGSF